MATLFNRISNIFAPPVTREVVEDELTRMRIRLIEVTSQVSYYSSAIQGLEIMLHEKQRQVWRESNDQA